jgi:hypothetical protein
MQTRDPRIWFPAKKYGWGWGPPCCWQGWVVMLAWLALVAAGVLILAPRNLVLFVAFTVVMGGGLIVVVAAKGEKPRWRWGDDANDKPKSTADRLAELETAHRRGLVSEAEYEAKRQEILKDL